MPTRKESVASLLDAGMETPEIAERLGISTKTVSNIKAQLRREALKLANNPGLSVVAQLDRLTRLRHRIYRRMMNDAENSNALAKLADRLLKAEALQLKILESDKFPYDDDRGGSKWPALTEIIDACVGRRHEFLEGLSFLERQEIAKNWIVEQEELKKLTPKQLTQMSNQEWRDRSQALHDRHMRRIRRAEEWENRGRVARGRID